MKSKITKIFIKVNVVNNAFAAQQKWTISNIGDTTILNIFVEYRRYDYSNQFMRKYPVQLQARKRLCGDDLA